MTQGTDLLTIKQAAEALGVGRRQLTRYRQRYGTPEVRRGKRVFFRPEDIEELKSLRNGTARGETGS
jgi:DNA-binding transcriptional MerR regulator